MAKLDKGMRDNKHRRDMIKGLVHDPLPPYMNTIQNDDTSEVSFKRDMS